MSRGDEQSTSRGRDVYIVSWFHPSPPNHLTGTFVGVYSSLEQAENAIKRLRPRATFAKNPDGFRVQGVMLDCDYDDYMDHYEVRRVPGAMA